MAPQAEARVTTAPTTVTAPAPRAAINAQPSLFGDPNVIPFEAPRKAVIPAAPPPLNELVEPTLEMPRPAAVRTAPRKAKAQPAVENLQTAMNFHSAGTQSARMLKTTVEAVIYCAAPVASPIHRALAGALDAGIILIAFGVFAVLVHFVAGPVLWNKISITIFAAAFGIVALFYGLIWAIAGRESAGMRTLQLKLINFDGFPPDGRSRAMRLCGTILGFCSGGLGLFWALVDEEDLGWHDRMSKTFPTIDEGRGFLKAGG